MNDRTRGWLLAALVSVMAIASVGIAAAATTGDLGTANQTIDNDTDQVYIDVSNTSNGPVNLVVYGVDNGTETQVLSTTVDAPSGTKTTYVDANTTAYESYRFVLNSDSSDTDTESVGSYSVGQTIRQSSGGGGILGGGSGGILTPINLAIGVLALGGAYVAGLFDPLLKGQDTEGN